MKEGKGHDNVKNFGGRNDMFPYSLTQAFEILFEYDCLCKATHYLGLVLRRVSLFFILFFLTFTNFNFIYFYFFP